MKNALISVLVVAASCGMPAITPDAGGPTAGGSAAAGGIASAGGFVSAGGSASAGGLASAGGSVSAGGSAAGGSASAGGSANAGGLASAGGTASAGGNAGGSVSTGRLIAYVGSGNGNITAYSVNPTTGAMTMLGATNGGTNPSFLAFDVPRSRLYAVNEGNPGQIAAFELRADAGLSLINRVSSQGAGPAHVSVHPSGRFVMAANYTGGNVAILPVRDGGLGAATDTDPSGGQAHQIIADATGRFVYVPCKAADHVAQYRFDADAGTLSPLTPATVSTAAGAGPRHLALHPGGQWAFLINELGDTMTSMRVAADGRLTAVDTKSTLPAGFSGNNTCAEVQVHPNGRFIFGSNRGHDSIVTFSFDETSGALTLVGHAPTGGTTPRHFELDPSGLLLLVANQGSGNVHALRIDPATGVLTPLGQQATVNSPAFVGMTLLP